MNDIPADVREKFIRDHKARKAETEREIEYLNECATDYFESHGARIATLNCGCVCRIREGDGGYTCWTYRSWDACDAHRELPL